MLFSGYIEGYFGRLLSWEERDVILSQIEFKNLNTYFYCPKEDPYHRLDWKTPYPEKEKKSLEEFITKCESKKINFFFGISPGINFEDSFEELFNKILDITSIGASEIVILFDDLFEEQNGKKHAEIINICKEKFPEVNFYCVPSEYCEQLAKPNLMKSLYLNQLSEHLDSDVPIFWTGSKVVSSSYTSKEIDNWKNTLNHKLIIWDNFYANDYCVPKIVLESFDVEERSNFENALGILINGTGLLNIDKFCLGSLANKIYSKDKLLNDPIKNLGLPKEFAKISGLFKLEAFYTGSKEEIEAIEFLLWKWTGPTKQEIYPYIHLLRKFLTNEGPVDLLKSRFNIKKI
ncbi:MAG: beta-N-acetylglucosaminidase domain-containing protein [Pseudomonadota bacterium]|nr:beta-N-acetylglucosaminidase domain-containing protein [Pseudomonadota bacterium]